MSKNPDITGFFDTFLQDVVELFKNQGFVIGMEQVKGVDTRELIFLFSYNYIPEI